MSRQKRKNETDIMPSANGRVRSFSGSGINATFESQKEADEHQDWLDEREALKKNPLQLKRFTVKVNSMR
ncbi:MAG: hypothetical protein LBG58_12145 [Planctomycetaceae bacterium]|jgi:hypothetical protein|nr:hypothetical protein [Planctomycetaceae bacterium]